MVDHPAHRPSQREALLEAALDLVRDGRALSLDAVARAAGLTKPGLLYHFPTKKALIVALVDHRLDAVEQEVRSFVPDRAASDAHARLTAYLRWSFEHRHDAADLVMFSDPRLRELALERWGDRFTAWASVPDHLDAATRSRLHAVRLLADGCWYADVTGLLPLPPAERSAVLARALTMLEES